MAPGMTSGKKGKAKLEDDMECPKCKEVVETWKPDSAHIRGDCVAAKPTPGPSQASGGTGKAEPAEGSSQGSGQTGKAEAAEGPSASPGRTCKGSRSKARKKAEKGALEAKASRID